jgi:glutaredoxin-like protein
MALLNQNDAKIVGEKLSGLPGSVKLALFTRELECDYCDQTRELVEELAALSAGKLTVEVYDLVKDAAKAQGLGIDKAPALAVLGADGEDRGLRFFGIPAGYEFASLLESLDLVARGDSGLAPAVREKLRSLKEPLALQVFVTPTCPYCPKAVLTAFKFAMESPLVTAAMVEATEFPELSSRYQVSGVPHTVIGGSPQAMIGAYPEGAAADMVLSAALRG